MEQTEKYRAVAELSALLRETTKSRLSFETGKEPDEISATVSDYYNIIFIPSEHETVKRAFLRLLSEL